MSRFLLGGVLLLCLCCGRASGQPAARDVVVNEILYAPSPSTNEFIELYNRTDAPVDLSRLSFADANRDFVPVAQAETTIAAHGYAVLVRDAEAFQDAFPTADGIVPPDWAALNNGGDTIFLRHRPTGITLDSVPYDPSWGGSDGSALERIDPAGPSDVASNFASSEAGATPGTQNSLYAPDETPPVLEQVTPSRDGDSLAVTFSEAIDASTVSTGAFQLEAAAAPSIASADVSDSSPRVVQCVLTSALSTGTYTLLVSGVADRRGNVLDEGRASFSFFVAETPQPGDVIVSEILYAPSSASTEFVELFNRSDKTIDLGSLRYADDDRDFDPVAAPLTPLEPGDYVVLVREAEPFETHFPSVTPLTPSGWDALNNGGDTVVLRHGPSATSLDAVPYDPSWGGREGRSLERVDPRGPSDVASNFATSTAPDGATPGRQNSRHDPDMAPPTPTFAEQVSETAVEVVFDEPIHPASVRNDAFELEEASVTSAMHPSPRIVRLVLSESPTGTSMTVTGLHDWVGNELERTQLPLAHRPKEGAFVVNEILFDPRADDFDDRPNQVEYVELFSLADRPLTLNRLFVTDRPTEQGEADTTRAGRRRVLPPGGFAVVAAAPHGSTQVHTSQLAAAFPEAPLSPDSVAFLPVDAARLGLDNEGDLVRVHRADGTTVTEVAYSPDWHAAGLAETKGSALERTSATAPANASDNWTSSTAPAGGTPGAPNAVSLAPPDDAPQAQDLRIEPSPFSIERDGGTRIQYTLNEVPTLVRVRIFDARGREVRALEQAHLAGRSGELLWNGRDDDGHRVRMGIYVVLFEAVRAEDGTVAELKETVVLARPLH